ncbi:hypothetical protein ZWY2020_052011 [Hordeum vulgare]|nr:hypothetical protein ZWY2020_052011 [Hordeum vulgare]
MLLAALCAAALAPAVSGQPMEALEACIGRCGCVPCPTGKVCIAVCTPPPPCAARCRCSLKAAVAVAALCAVLVLTTATGDTQGECIRECWVQLRRCQDECAQRQLPYCPGECKHERWSCEASCYKQGYPNADVRAAQPPPERLRPAYHCRRRKATTVPPWKANLHPPQTIPGSSDSQSPLPAGPAATTSAAMPPPSRPGFVPPRPIGAADPSQILAAKPPAPSKRGRKAGTGAGRQTTKRPTTGEASAGTAKRKATAGRGKPPLPSPKDIQPSPPPQVEEVVEEQPEQQADPNMFDDMSHR